MEVHLQLTHYCEVPTTLLLIFNSNFHPGGVNATR